MKMSGLDFNLIRMCWTVASNSTIGLTTPHQWTNNTPPKLVIFVGEDKVKEGLFGEVLRDSSSMMDYEVDSMEYLPDRFILHLKLPEGDTNSDG